MESKKLFITGRLNIPDYEANANLAYSIRLQHPVVREMEMQEDNEAIILAGGPSLNTQIDVIKKLKAEDPDHRPVLTMNNTHDWAIEHGITPQLHAMMDARVKNTEFIKKPLQTCKYLLASQCAPEVFRALKDYDVMIWHAANVKSNKELLNNYYMGFHWAPIQGGCTVGARAFHLLLTLGVANKFHLFGYDSCVDSDRPEVHHAYPQWSDTEILMDVYCCGRKFLCQPWMFTQAREFKEICKHFGDRMKIIPYGDGLIQHMIKTGGEIEENK